MKVITVKQALKSLKKINAEICYADCFRTKTFTSGLIAFQAIKKSDPRQIKHDHQDVICQVIKGGGRLRLKGRTIRLRPGVICHIPKGTPHDFAAQRSGELVLFYSLIKTT